MTAALLDKPRIRRSFAAASYSYDHAAHLQRHCAEAVRKTAEKTGIRGTVLDLGCGTGNLTALLNPAEHIVAVDIAGTMLAAARAKLSDRANLNYLCADAEKLPFANQSLDGVYSNLALQWCEQLGPVLAECHRVLKPGSPLVFSTFGPDTLHELKRAWAAVDDLPHVNDFIGETTLRQLLTQAGFYEITIERTLRAPRYASVVDLMRELKQIGAHNAHAARPKTLTGKSRIQAMVAAYEYNRQNGLLPATYEILIVTARAS